MADGHQVVDLAEDTLLVVGIAGLSEAVDLVDPMKKICQFPNQSNHSMQETNLNEHSHNWVLAGMEDRHHRVPVVEMRVAQVVGGCIGTGWEEIEDVVVVFVERDSVCNQRKLVEDTVVGWATVVVSGSLNVQSMAGTENGLTLFLKSFISGFVGK